ncbi:O-antigen ligase [Blastococcus colisei]|uniref:O-antigen ligase n=1 Tax=Blastococcus colisei TaxID=1564162 RepID=A0A543P1F4_9ACTN|nr:O-antigen ligase family protein [Blastococcus colisei]TQN37898.1 O-antigen ligase [Blastococcus colisei]
MSTTLLVAVALSPLLVAYVVACIRDPLRYAMPPYAVLIPFSSLISIGPGAFGSVSSLLGVLLGLGLLVQLVTTRRGSAHISLAVPVWLAFLALCGFSLFWSVSPTDTTDGFAVLASLVVLFVALVLTRFDQTTLRRFENAILLGGVLVVGYGLAQLLFLGGLPTGEAGGARFGEDLLGANNQAASLLLPTAIAAGRTVAGAVTGRLVYGAVTLGLLFGVVMTGSRGGLLAVIVVVGAVVLFGVAPRASKIALMATATVLLTFVIVVNPGGIGERQLGKESTSGRSEIWAVGVYACRHYCLTGAGWGGFPTVYAEERASVAEAKVLRRGTAFEPHNVYLLALIEAGVLGLVLVLVGLGIAVVTALRLPPLMRGPPVGAILGTLVGSFFLSNLEYKFFWAVLIYVAVSGSVAAAARAGNVPCAPSQDRTLVAAGQDGR